MLRMGLSGGIGAGKSTVAGRLRELGALVVDADQLAREAVAPGSEGLAAVAARFGTGVLGADGALDRAALGAIVFADPRSRAQLEQITHPLVARRAAELMAAAPPGQVVVHDVPLLVEKRMGAQYHLVVIVTADEGTRVERLTTGRGLTGSDARTRIAAQATDGQRRAAGDVLLDNSGSVADLVGRVDELWVGRLCPFNDNLLTGARASHSETLTLMPYDESWPEQADRLVQRLGLVLGGRALTIDHIGSTSVLGLCAKDVIDLQVGVRRLADADARDFVAALTGAGFPRSEGNIQDNPHPPAADPALWPKRFHGSADPGRIAHVHVREVGGPGWRYALLFRDWLRAVPQERDAYAGHKRDLAGSHRSTSDYAAAKEPWFAQARPRAEVWARHTGWSVG